MLLQCKLHLCGMLGAAVRAGAIQQKLLLIVRYCPLMLPALAVHVAMHVLQLSPLRQ